MLAISFDTETTGYDWVAGEIIEVGAVKFDTETFEIVDQYESLLKPIIKKLPPKIVEVTKITDKQLLKAPPAKQVLKELNDFMSGHPIVAHNAMFDARFFGSSCAKYGIDLYDYEFIDSLKIAKYLIKQAANHKLEYLVKEFYKFPPGSSHRACSDAIDTIRILKEISKESDWEEMSLCGGRTKISQMKEFKVNYGLTDKKLIRGKKYKVDGKYDDELISFTASFLMDFVQAKKDLRLFYDGKSKKYIKVNMHGMKIEEV